MTNDQTLNLNPLEVNDLNDYLWDEGTLLTCTDALDILEDGWRPWPRVKDGIATPLSSPSSLVSPALSCFPFQTTLAAHGPFKVHVPLREFEAQNRKRQTKQEMTTIP